MTIRHIARLAGAATFATVLPAHASLADGLPDPSGDIVLTVTGDLAATNGDDVAQFDLEMLRSMDSRSFVTETIWTDGAQTFEGVGLDTLLETLGVEEGTLTATAINDYAVVIPIEDAVADGPIIAYSRNGDLMSVRDKGPLWIVYPYDANPEYRSERVYARSIWQLDRITVTD